MGDAQHASNSPLYTDDDSVLSSGPPHDVLVHRTCEYEQLGIVCDVSIDDQSK